VVDEMEGVAVVCLTRFTSLKASSDHRSTFRTYIVCSISLQDKQNCEHACSRAENVHWNATYLQFTSLPVFLSMTISLTQGGGVIGRRSLSPKPHIRARCGCCTTTNLEEVGSATDQYGKLTYNTHL